MSSPQGQPAAVPSRGGGKKGLVLAAGALLLLAGAGVVYLRRGGGTSAPVARKAGPPVPGVVELEPFVLNLADPAGDRYFRLTVRIVLDRREVAERAADGLGKSKLRDQILSVLSRKRASDMTRPEGRDLLRAEIQGASEALLARPPFLGEGDSAPAHVVEVYFTEFLVQ